MNPSEKAYRDIEQIIDKALLGSDTKTDAISPHPEDTRLMAKRPVKIVALDEPRLLPNGQVFDPLLSDSESQARLTPRNPDLITINGEWTSADFVHRLEICAEISNSTRRGRLYLNGRQFDI